MTRFVANELATTHWFDITAARRDLDSRSVLVTVEVAPCDCEENPAPTYAGERWRCLAGWRLVAMPERR